MHIVHSSLSFRQAEHTVKRANRTLNRSNLF